MIGSKAKNDTNAKRKVHKSYALIQTMMAGGSQDGHAALADKQGQSVHYYTLLVTVEWPATAGTSAVGSRPLMRPQRQERERRTALNLRRIQVALC